MQILQEKLRPRRRGKFSRPDRPPGVSESGKVAYGAPCSHFEEGVLAMQRLPEKEQHDPLQSEIEKTARQEVRTQQGVMLFFYLPIKY